MLPPSIERLDPPSRATVNQAVDTSGNRYLHAICRQSGHAGRAIDAIDRLKADVNTVNTDGYSPLRYAIEYGDSETVAALLKRGARASYTTGSKTYNAVTAAILRGRSDILEAVLRSGGAALVNSPGIDTRSEVEKTPALVLAVQKYHYDLIPLLARAGADLNRASDTNGMTPVMQAAQNDAAGVIQTLVRLGADVNAAGASGQTALHLAAAHNDHRVSVMDALLALGADVNARDGKGRTPLMLAIEAGNIRMATKLIAAGAQLDAQNAQDNNESALMIAARKGHGDAAALLLKAGADVLLCDRFNRTAAKIAEDHPGTNRSMYDPMMGFSAPQPKTMLQEAEKKAMAQKFEGQYRDARRRHGP